jgi:hypothetical protein
MEIKFNVKRKFIVNGKEYGSLEEMPAAIREAYEKAVSKSKGIEHGNITSVSSEKIVFNGQEYENVNSMPADIRQMYETVMKTVSEGKLSVTGNIDFKFGKKAADLKNEGVHDSYSMSKPIAPKSFFSPRVLIIVAAILALLVGIYFLISIGGSK